MTTTHREMRVIHGEPRWVEICPPGVAQGFEPSGVCRPRCELQLEENPGFRVVPGIGYVPGQSQRIREHNLERRREREVREGIRCECYALAWRSGECYTCYHKRTNSPYGEDD